ncbi:hypothetical protein SBP02_04950 [Pseudomonas benzenivorans]|uniref:DUF4426 domain-containing protein n=1 Tax=Pseudomonas benzenivorans TaxID=556533 RepID=A0ABZ0PY68_9PSED|nr:hypothetical protein [Pseudomonas benzenivorans]WPC06104.1 hypothetical protein SBP02_04950 [Pseudomonas benzenivorans]
MNIRRVRLTVPLLALAGAAAGLLSRSAGAAPSQPQPQSFARRESLLVVPIAGSLDGEPEDIELQGRAKIRSTAFTDADLGEPPGVLLAIDFLNVIGVGESTGTRYFVHGEHTVVRRLRESDRVELSFPISPVGARETAATRAVRAAFELSFDLDNGKLQAATARFSSPES